jgi:hypothetical protein
MSDRDFRPAEKAIQRAAARTRLPLAEVREYSPDCVRDGLAEARVLDRNADWHELNARDRAEGQFDFSKWTIVLPKVRGLPLDAAAPIDKADDTATMFFRAFLEPAPIEIDTISLADGVMLFNRERRGRRRGRPAEHDMAGLAIEAAAWIHWNGVPKPQTLLVNHLLDFASLRSNRHPDEREVRRLVAAICEAIDRQAKIFPISPRAKP